MNTAGDYLTADQAARQLGIKRATLYAYVSRGVLRSYRQGIKRERLYLRADVERLLRVAPSGAGPPPRAPSPRLREWDIPLAETWMRD
ncbi:MAG: helix-turn-helix domain-containing protein [Candidatus Rokuibacteriota bacterium]